MAAVYATHGTSAGRWSINGSVSFTAILLRLQTPDRQGQQRQHHQRQLRGRQIGDRLPVMPWVPHRPPARGFDPTGLEPEKLGKLKERRPRIRCPICFWEPRKRDKWSCAAMGAPEHFPGGCGKVWHTFDTRGLCPGCQHQWQHTSCLRCSATSLHEDWYEKAEGKPQ